MEVEFLDPAARELMEAIGHYNDESEELGFQFAAEVNRAVGRWNTRMRGHACQNGLGAVGRTGSRAGLSTRSGATRF